jgi:hypothetical protein
MKLEDKQTAVEWLFIRLWDTPKDKLTWWAIFDEAMAIEKEQIINAYSMGISDEGRKTINTMAFAEEYYDETYAN